MVRSCIKESSKPLLNRKYNTNWHADTFLPTHCAHRGWSVVLSADIIAVWAIESCVNNYAEHHSQTYYSRWQLHTCLYPTWTRIQIQMSLVTSSPKRPSHRWLWSQETSKGHLEMGKPLLAWPSHVDIIAWSKTSPCDELLQPILAHSHDTFRLRWTFLFSRWRLFICCWHV